MAPYLETPLGTLTFFACLGNEVMQVSAPGPDPTSSGVQVTFETSGARGQFTLRRIEPGLLPAQQVDACYGVWWQIEALHAMPEHHWIEFTCTWAGAPLWTSTGWHGARRCGAAPGSGA